MNPIVNFSLHCYQICEINKNQLHGKRIVSGPVRFRLSIFCRGGCSRAVLFDDNHLWLILGWVRISAEMKTGLGLGQGWVLRDKTLDAGIKNSHFSISWSPIFKWWCTASVSMYCKCNIVLLCFARRPFLGKPLSFQPFTNQSENPAANKDTMTGQCTSAMGWRD